MKKTFIYTYKDMKKGKNAVLELRRAHLIIALLSISLAFTVAIASIYPIQLDEFLASVAASLLIIVAAISLTINLMMKSK